MRTFIFTYDRYDTINTAPLMDAEQLPYTALCHTDEQREQFVAAGRVRPDALVATGNPKGLAYNRNAALDMMDDDEWALFLVDDLQHVEELDGYDYWIGAGAIPITRENQREWAAKMKHRVSVRHFVERAESLIPTAERYGARLVGFAGFDNPMFRARRWKLNCLADGRAWLVRKGDIRFDEHVQMIDDVCWTAQNLQRYGVVMVDAWVLPKCKRYTRGAYGTIEQRLSQKAKEVSYLIDTYPAFCATRRKPGWPDGTHVVIRPRRH